MSERFNPIDFQPTVSSGEKGWLHLTASINNTIIVGDDIQYLQFKLLSFGRKVAVFSLSETKDNASHNFEPLRLDRDVEYKLLALHSK